MEERTLKNVNNFLDTNIYYCFETSVGQSIQLIFLKPVSIRHVWQLKIADFQHWCLIHYVLLTPVVAF
jgi:hypothetical protein